jgi:hypothetical protein
MSNVRVWIALLALTCFAAGLSSGMFLAAQRKQPELSREPFEDYRAAFVERFALEAQRAELFRDLLREYHEELEAARTGVLARSRSELEPQLEQIGVRYAEAIRDHVLPPERRAEFDALKSEWRTIQ